MKAQEVRFYVETGGNRMSRGAEFYRLTFGFTTEPLTVDGLTSYEAHNWKELLMPCLEAFLKAIGQRNDLEDVLAEQARQDLLSELYIPSPGPKFKSPDAVIQTAHVKEFFRNLSLTCSRLRFERKHADPILAMIKNFAGFASATGTKAYFEPYKEDPVLKKIATHSVNLKRGQNKRNEDPSVSDLDKWLDAHPSKEKREHRIASVPAEILEPILNRMMGEKLEKYRRIAEARRGRERRRKK